ncbi:MAG: hypothetical protein JSU87_05910 [Gemmatimonadota bacterium]|nr:MAG: hypothetical protein JSU87_05910 [Gemmatimonadota bacterium]
MIEDIPSLAGLFRLAWRRGGPRSRIAIIASLAGIAGAFLLIAMIHAALLPFEPWNRRAFVLLLLAVICLLFVAGVQAALLESERNETIERAEQRLRESPGEPLAAWDLARVKLESYLNRNLKHIRWIFGWTVLVMLVGFVVIGYGIVRVYEAPENLGPSVVATLSGVLIEFIGATFLVLYRSTLAQAKDFVNVLERINAVGMSVQILDQIEDHESNLRDETRAEIAKSLLSLYSSAE